MDFIAKLRHMLTFEGAEELIEQMNVDAVDARRMLAEDAARLETQEAI